MMGHGCRRRTRPTPRRPKLRARSPSPSSRRGQPSSRGISGRCHRAQASTACSTPMAMSLCRQGAISLKKRVSNYAQGGHSNRIARMIALTAAMEFVTTRTETEALLLEANLIKRLRPRFNVLLRDDKSFPYILMAAITRRPIVKHRGARNSKGDYFGPFASPARWDRTINALQRRSCCAPAPTASSRAAPGPACSTRSSAARPCTGEISRRTMPAGRRGKAFLSGQIQSRCRRSGQAQMEEASENLDFERAAVYRDRYRR
jgi:excinuclease ABC subunit C